MIWAYCYWYGPITITMEVSKIYIVSFWYGNFNCNMNVSISIGEYWYRQINEFYWVKNAEKEISYLDLGKSLINGSKVEITVYRKSGGTV